ncbi:MAG TPA: GNAT family N-acetyltransferase [Rubricoccaceae bacterium]|jgi:ribosomal protein S18 acetylase RimI-like enzyme
MPDLPTHYHTRMLPAADAEARFGPLLAPPLDLRRRLGPVAEHVFAVVATLGGQTVGVGLGGVRPGTGIGEVLCLGAVAAARRRGIGSGLLIRLERALADAGCAVVQGTFRSDWTGADATAALLAAAGWQPPVAQKLLYKMEGRTLDGPRVLRALALPEGYTVSDWDSITDADRTRVADLLARDAATRPIGPFDQPVPAVPGLSVWLRHSGEIVGWHVVLAPEPRAIEHAGLYVAPEHRRSRAGLALVGEALRRHDAARALPAGTPGHAPETAVFAVEPRNDAMRALADAWFGADGVTKTTVWLAGKRLDATE